MGAQFQKKKQAYSQPLFGRGPGGGKDSHSRQWRLSMAVFLNRNKRPLAAPIEVAELLSEKPPPPEFFSSPSFRVGARGRGLFFRKVPSLAILHKSILVLIFQT